MDTERHEHQAAPDVVHVLVSHRRRPERPVHNEAVRADLLARYEKMPHVFPDHGAVFAMQSAVIYFKDQLRAAYLPAAGKP
jgi:hypothetical protein